MSDFLNSSTYFSYDVLLQLSKVFLVLMAGYVINRLLSLIIFLTFKNNQDKQRLFITQKLVKYTLAVVTVMVILKIFNVNLKVILGAAGVLSIAIGFAAQTSISNLISGIFLIFERPFVVGDLIEVGEVKGEVLSVDLLSMRIKTMQNLLIRVPNEVVMKSQIINYSHFPIRRYDIIFSLSYYEDLDKVRELLVDLVENNPFCLDEPEPLFLVQKMGEYFIEIKFGVWGESKQFLELQQTFSHSMRLAFIKNNIALPVRSMKFESPLPTPPPAI